MWRSVEGVCLPANERQGEVFWCLETGGSDAEAGSAQGGAITAGRQEPGALAAALAGFSASWV